MGFFDRIKQLAQSAQQKLPDDMDSISEAKDKAQQFAQDNSDKINQVGDQVKQRIDGDADDKVIDGIEQKIKAFGDKK